MLCFVSLVCKINVIFEICKQTDLVLIPALRRLMFLLSILWFLIFPSFCFVHHVGFVDIELSRIVHKSISTNSIRIDPIGHCNVCLRCLSFFLFISNIYSNLDHIDVFKSLKNVYQNLSLKSSTCMYFFLLFFLHKFVWECLSIKYQCRFLCFKRRLFLSDIYRRCLNFICFDADKCWSFSENCWDWFK